MQFTVAIEPGNLAQLDEVVTGYAAPARAWWQQQRAAILSRPSSAAACRQALAELRVERFRRRLAGELFDTRSSLIAYHLRQELDRRGWLHRRWPAVPRGESTLPGARWGVPHEGGRSARMVVELADADGERLRRATWHTSAAATRQLQARSWLSFLQAERLALQREIVTTGDLLRAAAYAAIAAGHPADTDAGATGSADPLSGRPASSD